MTKRSRTLRYKVLMIGLLLAVVAWTVVWFMVATVVDRHAEKAEDAARDAGAIAECLNRSVQGFPFRIEVRCAKGSRIGNREASVTVDGLTAAALIYKPSRLIFETQGPAIVDAPGMPEVAADWDLAHASARVDLDNQALERLDFEVKKGTVVIGGAAPIPFHELDINVRRNPADASDLDVNLHLDKMTAPLVGTMPLSLIVRGTLASGAPLLAGHPEETVHILATEGLTFAIDTATLEMDETILAAGGQLTLGSDGLLSGKIDVALAGVGEELPIISVVAPEAEATIASVLGNVLAFAPSTMIGDRAAKKLSLTVRNGKVSAGIIPLFTIPPVDFSASLL